MPLALSLALHMPRPALSEKGQNVLGGLLTHFLSVGRSVPRPKDRPKNERTDLPFIL